MNGCCLRLRRGLSLQLLPLLLQLLLPVVTCNQLRHLLLARWAVELVINELSSCPPHPCFHQSPPPSPVAHPGTHPARTASSSLCRVELDVFSDELDDEGACVLLFYCDECRVQCCINCPSS